MYPLYFEVIIGSTCQCMSMIAFWVRTVLSNAKAYVSEYSLGCCSIVALVAGVFLMLILQAGDWATVPTPGS